MSGPAPPVGIGPLVIPCTSGFGRPAGLSDAGALYSLGHSEHACCGTASGGVGASRFQIENIVISGPVAGSIPISLNLHIRGSVATNIDNGQAGVQVDALLQGFNTGLSSTRQFEMNPLGIVVKTDAFGPLDLGFPRALFDDQIVILGGNAVPNTPLTLGLRLEAMTAMAGTGSTDSDFHNSPNGLRFPTDRPVFNLPAGYTVDIPGLNVFANCVDVEGNPHPDLDGDGTGDACDPDDDDDGVADGAPLDPSLATPPDEVTGVRFPADSATIPWDPAVSILDVAYDARRGPLTGPPGSGADFCLVSSETDPSLVDPDLPSPGEGFWYVIRALNPCGGTWGGPSDGPEYSLFAYP